MISFRNLIARCLLFVMLATVFSPGFGWEAAQGAEVHEHLMAADEHAGHHDMLAMDELTAADTAHDCDGCGGHETAPCSDALHHCCPGYVLGHLPATLAGLPAFVPLAQGQLALGADADRFTSRIPEGLERPPRHAVA